MDRLYGICSQIVSESDVDPSDVNTDTIIQIPSDIGTDTNN